MYNSQEMANRIKATAKSKKIPLKKMLSDCGLGINLISQLAKGQSITYVNLAKIADYLDCSVDYLLGRTDDVDNILDSKINDDISEDLVILNRNAKKLSPENRKKLLEIAKVMFKEDFDD